ncbi:MAG TPA: serine hydrolase domain-containing protein [Chloroflexota bacterium]|nr:serine hydrolase domain-containing protein [Chloroflexota bacterium]
MIDGTASAEIRRAAEETMRVFQVPGLVVVATRGGQPLAQLFLGGDAAGHAVAPDSIFPVASVTKLATALAVLRLVDAGTLALDDALASVLPDAAAAQTGVTTRTLLCHDSGLPLDPRGETSLYAPGLTWPTLAQACLQTSLRWPPGSRVQYSNVGYGLLAVVVERLVGQAFPTALRSLVLDPLGIEGYLGSEPPRAPMVIADVRGPHADTPLAPFNAAFWRSLALPWAGLLTSVAGALGLLRAYQGLPVDFLELETLADATRNQTDDLGGGYAPPLVWPRCPWGLGPELRDQKTPHWAPAQAGPDSFGHAGASGCVAWSDPSTVVDWAILGTRTADNGWLVRRGPALGAAILAAG